MVKFLLNKIRTYSKSIFVKNIAKLASGTFFAQVMSMLMAPILYRIYDKELYGILGVFIAISGVLSSFSSMQYSQAILLEKEDENAIDVLWLVRFINATLAFLVFIGVLFFSEIIANSFNSPELVNWLFLLPISIFFNGQNEIFRFWANRKGKFGIMRTNSILVSVSVPVISISFGLLYESTPLGLFLGLVVGQIIPAVSMFWFLSKEQSFGLATLKFSGVKEKLVKYKRFPMFSLPSEFINRFSNQLPVFMLTTFAGPAAVGAYNLTVRMLSLPIQLLSNSVYEVFRKRAVEDVNKIGNCKRIFVKTFKTLSALSVVPSLVILLFGTQLFTFVFGEEWYMAGVFSQILCGLYFVKFIVSPLSYMFILFQKQKQDFFWHIWMLVSSVGAFYIGYYYDNNIYHSLMAFAGNYVIIYGFTIFFSFKYSKGVEYEI